MNKVISFFF